MDIRRKVVKALYPLCSDEVKIMIDQMEAQPDRFYGTHGRFGMYEGEYEWEAVAAGHFGIIDGLAIKVKNRDIRIQISKERILEKLLDSKAGLHEREDTSVTNHSIHTLLHQQLVNSKTTPNKIVASQAQIDALKAAQQKTLEYMKQQMDAHMLAAKPGQFKGHGKRKQ